MNDKEISEKISKMIIDDDKNLSRVSRRLNIDYQRLYRILNYGAIITGSEFLKICNYLKVDPQIFKETG